MNRPAVFFDRDNTLIVSGGYLGDPEQVELVEGAADAVAKVRAMGFAAVVFSNQSGVARGMFGEEAVYAVNHRLDELLNEDNPAATIDRHEFCPYHPEAVVERYRKDSDLRKPKPGMILQAARTLSLDLSRSWVIGDAPRDLEAGRAAGCKTIWLRVPGLPESEAANQPVTVTPDFVATSLGEAVGFIERHRPAEAATVGGAVGATESNASEAPEAPEAPEAAEPAAQPVGSEPAQAESLAPAEATAETAVSESQDRPHAAAPAKPAMTWGERMRAAKAQGMLPVRTADHSATPTAPLPASAAPEPVAAPARSRARSRDRAGVRADGGVVEGGGG